LDLFDDLGLISHIGTFGDHRLRGLHCCDLSDRSKRIEAKIQKSVHAGRESNVLLTGSIINSIGEIKDMDVRYISAVLFVKDIVASRRFYEGMLGQQVDTDFGKNVGYKSGLALWEAGIAHRHIHGLEDSETAPLGRNNFEIYFESDDIEIAWRELQTSGARVIQPLYEQPWAQRALRVADPDGHIVEIGESMALAIRRLAAQGLDHAAISVKTMMPLPAIEKILQHN
jgi:catechol 2,3-dioxygenase-like lactoylglutathione lyase family enzyme